MDYYPNLSRKLEQVERWIKLRHEQQTPGVKQDVAKLEKHLGRLIGKLQKARPAPAMAANEPNALRDIRAARAKGPRKMWERFDKAEYRRRVEGAWLARAAGCTLGAIVEGASMEHMEALAKYLKIKYPLTDYWPEAANPSNIRYEVEPCWRYAGKGIEYIPADDDLTYTLLGLLIMEDYGVCFTTEQVGKAWVKYLPMACTAEKVALEHLKAGRSWKICGERDNPFMEYIGDDIRSDPWAYAAPGWPEKAAELAYRDAYLSHRYNGIYGEMYFSAAIAAAFAVDDPMEACEIALSEIPRRCRLHTDVAWALKQASKLKDYRHAAKLVRSRFPCMSQVHTNNNACLTIFGLALGGRDVTKVIGNTIAMGYDNDCTAATAGSIVGAAVGIDGVPKHWYKPFNDKARTYLKGREWFRNSGIVRRFTKIAAKVWRA